VEAVAVLAAAVAPVVEVEAATEAPAVLEVAAAAVVAVAPAAVVAALVAGVAISNIADCETRSHHLRLPSRRSTVPARCRRL